MIAFKIVPFWVGTQLHTMLLMFKAILQVMFCKAVQDLYCLLSHVLPTQNGFLWALTWSLGRGRSRCERGLASRVGAQTQCCFYLLKIASQTMRCGLARCPGAKYTRSSIIPVVPFSRVHAISSRLHCNTANLPSGRWVPTLPSQYPGYQRKQSTWPWTSNDPCVLFFGLGDDVDFHCSDCRFVSGSNVNTQVS